jgi:hypothetical protein
MLDSNLKADDLSDLQDMLDHYRITKVLAEYCHGCDRLDQDLMAGTYDDDSWDDHGPNKMDGKKFAAYCMTSLGNHSNSCSHQLGQSLIKVDGDTAGAETYFIATLRVPRDGGEVLNQIAGRYVDKLQRVDGKWKIKHRLCVRDWSITHTVKEDFLANDPIPFIQGGRLGKDVAVKVLGFDK